MTKLERAIRAAEERKLAGLGDAASGIHFSSGEQADRAIFSGFDIGYGELAATSTEVAEIYMRASHSIGLRPLFISSWCDGLLTGMLLASLPPESDPGVKDDTGTGEE